MSSNAFKSGRKFFLGGLDKQRGQKPHRGGLEQALGGFAVQRILQLQSANFTLALGTKTEVTWLKALIG